jgi:hypothetical protein
MRSHSVPKLTRVAIASVGEHDLSRYLVFDRLSDEVEGQFRLRLEHEVIGNPRHLASLGVLGPRLGHVESKIDGDMLVPRCDRKADSNLTVADLSKRP